MNESALHYQKLLSDALQKQMVILGSQIALMRARSIPGMYVSDRGEVEKIENDPQKTVTEFLEAFRDLSSPLVKKTMKPLLSTINPAEMQTEHPEPAHPPEKQEVKIQEEKPE